MSDHETTLRALLALAANTITFRISAKGGTT